MLPDIHKNNRRVDLDDLYDETENDPKSGPLSVKKASEPQNKSIGASQKIVKIAPVNFDEEGDVENGPAFSPPNPNNDKSNFADSLGTEAKINQADTLAAKTDVNNTLNDQSKNNSVLDVTVSDNLVGKQKV